MLQFKFKSGVETFWLGKNLDKNSNLRDNAKFNYEGFKLITRQDFFNFYPQATEKILSLTYSEDFTK